MIHTNFAKKSKKTHDEFLVEKIFKYGQLILITMPDLIDGALPLLEWAHANYKLALVTRGQEKMQSMKIAHTEIEKYFSHIRIVPDKTPKTFRSVMDEMGYEPNSTWVIGNSISKDINPAITVGTNCILYAYKHDSYHWRRKHNHLLPWQFHKAESLAEVKNILMHYSPKNTVP